MSDFELPSFGPAPGAQDTREALKRHYDSFRITQLNGVSEPYGLLEFTAGVRTFLAQLEALVAPSEAPVTHSRRARKQE